MVARQELGVLHAAASKRTRQLAPGEPGADADERDVVLGGHFSHSWESTRGALAAPVLPKRSTLAWWRAGSMPARSHTASSMRRFAWWPTKWSGALVVAAERREPGERLGDVFLIANICTARPSWRKWPVRGITHLVGAGGVRAERRAWSTLRARRDSRVETTAAAAPSPKSTAVARSL